MNIPKPVNAAKHVFTRDDGALTQYLITPGIAVAGGPEGFFVDIWRFAEQYPEGDGEDKFTVLRVMNEAGSEPVVEIVFNGNVSDTFALKSISYTITGGKNV